MKNDEYWQRIFDEQTQSGLTQSKFCDSKGISYKSFCVRKSRMNQTKTLFKKTKESNFVKLKKEIPHFSDLKCFAECLRIKTKSGIEIEFAISNLPSVIKILNQGSGF